MDYVVRLFLTLTCQVGKKKQATITNGMRGENNEDLYMKREFLFTHAHMCECGKQRECNVIRKREELGTQLSGYTCSSFRGSKLDSQEPVVGGGGC